MHIPYSSDVHCMASRNGYELQLSNIRLIATTLVRPRQTGKEEEKPKPGVEPAIDEHVGKHSSIMNP